ncbi:glycerophosphodiester phosphodiesterase family protein [Falsirhodobacter algicola]|uniref:Phosphodiesterase n=1 Tax=Falsirhodobacter algicola TaxID=2692330 RepID=A0A8J8MTH8_9RHOB|nr:glycerophosphodiester phosphodiesterase family protein [Falsirhodobacter algicola]QUS35958.1 phosphodiesterase [Falsirhodobacter algicola]
MRLPLPPPFLRRPIAHRALHDRAAGRVENSRAAIRAAVEAGYGIEIDLQLSSDGVPMVFHDDTLDRLTEAAGPVRSRTAADLGALTLRDAGDGIPTLAEVLGIVGTAVPLLIELKTQYPADGALERATAAALQRHAGPVAVMGFSPDSVALMAELAPTIPRGITTCSYRYEDWPRLTRRDCDLLREIPDYERVEASFISHEAADLGRDRVAELKAEGAVILCWTIRSQHAEDEARRIADNVTFEGYRAAKPA